MERAKRFWLIAGPQGVGKTTYAFRNVPAVSGSMNFVSLYEIARGLSPLAPSLGARRVAEGGHDAPEDIVRRRSARSHANLSEYTAEADLWRIYEASGPKPCLAAEGVGRKIVHIDADCLATANADVRSFVRSLSAG